jgi:PAS domain S-box-containing protein
MASQTHAKLLALLEQTSPFFIVHTDTGGEIQSFNALFENQFASPGTPIIGQNIGVFFSEEDQYIYQSAFMACKEQKTVGQTAKLRLKIGEPAPFYTEWEIMHVEENIFLFLGKILPWDNVPKNFPLEFAKHQDRLKTIFEHATNPMLIVNSMMECKEANPAACELLGYTHRQLLAMAVSQFLHASVPYQVLLKDFLEKGKQTGRIQLVTREGIIRTVVYSAIAHVVDDLHLVIITDMTEHIAQEQMMLKQNQQLRKLNQEKNKLFSIIAHDLKGPLTNLSSLLNLLNKGHITQEEFQRMLEGLSENVTHSANLLQNLLSWAKSQLKGVKCVREHFSFCQLLHEKVDFFKMETAKKQLTMTHYTDGPIWILADRNMVDLILHNLLSNAIKFSHLGAQIEVKAKYVGKWAEICVEDSGVGIPKKSLNKIFAQTYSTKGTANEKGTGLGLSVCQEFVEQNGGKIWVESQLGKGTKFYFTLRKGKKGADIL